MQTFLPYRDFIKSAQCLDRQRLGKQRVEAMQIHKILMEEKAGGSSTSRWRTHPAVRMWKGYESALALYGLNMCAEWRKRGYIDKQCMKYFAQFLEQRDGVAFLDGLKTIEMPCWLGSKEFHDSHRSNLLRKNLEYYGNNGWQVAANLPYIWPLNMKR